MNISNKKDYPIMLVSVIVTAYNQANTIKQTLDSIFSQKCEFPFEIIIGDDCSTDGTQFICTEYNNRYPEIVQLLYHAENVGVAANFALCIQKAKGKYITLCAADDFWHNPAKLQLQVDYLESHPDYGLIYTDYDKLNIHTGKTIRDYLKTSKKKIYVGSGLITTFFKGQVPTLTLTVMFRKDLFDKYVPADDYIKYRFPLEDWPTWLILSKYTKIGYLPISTGTYRYGHESISNPIQYEVVKYRFNKEHMMYKYLCDMFSEDLSYDENSYLSYVSQILLNLAYKKFDFPAAKKYANEIENYGSRNLKVMVAHNKFTFQIFALLKLFKTRINIANER